MTSQTGEDGTGVLEHLTRAGVELQQALGSLRKSESQLKAAGQRAAEQGRIAPQIRSLRKDIDALANIVGETIVDLIRRSAEIEAKSQG